ncbi:hypothetical protein Tco_0896611 [Tanacetum coccineum]
MSVGLRVGNWVMGFIKGNMSRENDFVSFEVKTTVATVDTDIQEKEQKESQNQTNEVGRMVGGLGVKVKEEGRRMVQGIDTKGGDDGVRICGGDVVLSLVGGVIESCGGGVDSERQCGIWAGYCPRKGRRENGESAKTKQKQARKGKDQVKSKSKKGLSNNLEPDWLWPYSKSPHFMASSLRFPSWTCTAATSGDQTAYSPKKSSFPPNKPSCIKAMLAIPHLSQVSSMAEIDSKEAQMKLKAGICFRTYLTKEAQAASPREEDFGYK